MNKCRKMVLFSCFVMLIYSSIGLATDYDDNSQLESDIETKTYAQPAYTMHRLLPVRMMAIYLDSPEVFSGSQGLVKQPKYHLLTHIKIEK